MKATVKPFILILLLPFFFHSVMADKTPLHEPTQPVRVVFVKNIPPFVMDSGGIFIELIEEALRRLGLTMKSVEFPSRRLDEDPLTKFENIDLFVGTPVKLQNDYHYVQLFQFDNVAVSKKSSNLMINHVDDLEGKSILAFNNAKTHLKEPFRTFYQNYLVSWPGYREVENQYYQFKMLLFDQVDVILLDRHMVHYYAGLLNQDKSDQLVFHEIFKEKNTVYVVGKRQEFMDNIKDKLEQMYSDGWVELMLERYR